ncbi:unnamed protein product [Chondrus crispus]|uniref:Endonuclease/exonuclease/phosphatase domain-containing protein n=1 Tax=Chondrus crispus TaxID=2769 RepID=R7Q9Q7_CHOCR|nr:unnamed protein product [Chondrus crispus]CDF34488.1 unnamed protein product [Chondrus crispus]|eukprot:XP_005714307.1 unnamed protein product [Chondrus crispus]
MRYHLLKGSEFTKRTRRRAVAGLRRLRQRLDAQIPAKDSEQHLLLATWNIRDLTKTSRRRLPESLFYLAEVISRFDIVAIQEVNALKEWERIMYILGPDWDYIATDEADRENGGNGERLTYVFDRRKVSFQNIAGELVLPPSALISAETKTGLQFARTPYVALFQSGWFKFALCTVHIYFGKNYGEKLEQRRLEIEAVARYFGTKSAKEFSEHERTLILLGDFNIISPKHKTMAALEGQGFKIPKALRKKPSNSKKTSHYDQIAFGTRQEVLEFVDRFCDDPRDCNAGVFDPFESVYRAEDEERYLKEQNGDQRAFETWRTYEISDHQAMWVRLQVNSSEEYLKSLGAIS